MRRTLAPLAVALLVLSIAPRAEGLRRARPYRLELLAPLPAPFPPDGALIVAPLPAPAEGNREPRSVRITGPDGARVATRVEELAPDLFRVVPSRRLARGRHVVRGIGGGAITLTFGGRAGAAPPPPSVRSVVRSTERTGTADAVTTLEQIDVTLAAPTTGAIAFFARWPDWHDAEGGRYGAWTTPGDATTFPLICTAERRCPRVHGHVPRPRERGELFAIDAAGRVSPASPAFVVE